MDLEVVLYLLSEGHIKPEISKYINTDELAYGYLTFHPDTSIGTIIYEPWNKRGPPKYYKNSNKYSTMTWICQSIISWQAQNEIVFIFLLVYNNWSILQTGVIITNVKSHIYCVISIIVRLMTRSYHEISMWLSLKYDGVYIPS